MIHNLLDKLFGNDDLPKQGAPKNIKHDPGLIGSLLTQFQAQDHLVTAIMMNVGQRTLARLTTGILAVDASGRQFTTDEFQPGLPVAQLKAGSRLKFSLTHENVRHQFDAVHTGSQSTPEGVRHTFQFPKGIEQIQLRDAVRVKLSPSPPIRVTLARADQSALAGSLVDLSSSGMRVRLDGMASPKPTRGEVYEACHFHLDDATAIACSARLVHWQYDPDRRVSYLGVQFQSMDTGTQRSLKRRLGKLQRGQHL